MLLPRNVPQGEGARSCGARRQAGVNRENMGAFGWRTEQAQADPSPAAGLSLCAWGLGAGQAPEPEAAAKQSRLTLSASALTFCGSLQRGPGRRAGTWGWPCLGRNTCHPVTSLQPRLAEREVGAPACTLSPGLAGWCVGGYLSVLPGGTVRLLVLGP